MLLQTLRLDLGPVQGQNRSFIDPPVLRSLAELLRVTVDPATLLMERRGRR